MIQHITTFVLRSRLLILSLACLLVGAGFHSYRSLPVDAFPDVSPNLVQVFTVTEGLAPEEIEKFVTYPVEIAMNGLPGIEKVRSVSNFGLSVVNIYFEESSDLYFARQLVNERLQEAREQIPEGFGEPELGPIATGMGLVLFYYLEDESGNYSLEELRSIQDWVVKVHLQTVPGVTEVLGIGGYEKQFQVVIHPELLLRFKLTLSEVIEKIKANNLNVGASFLESNSEEFVVRSIGLARNIEDIRNVVLKSEHGTPVYLKQVADIDLGGAIRRGLQTRDGLTEVVAGMVVKLFRSNSSVVIQEVELKLQEINSLLPEGVRIVPYYEQKTLVEACTRTVGNALIQGIGLVILVLFAFMRNIRASLVVALSIPFSVLFAMLGMRYFGISANLMSFGGIAIAIGMMVDGTIVIVENVDRLLRSSASDEPRWKTVAKAVSEVGRPLAFAIAIIIVVFLPLFTLEGVEGKTFRPLAYAVALAMLGSLLFAIFIAPVLSELLMRRGSGNVKASPQGSGRLHKVYEDIVRYFISRRIVAVVASIILLLLGISLFPFLGAEFTPKMQEGTIVTRLTMAPSISLSESKRTTMLAEKRLMKIPEVRNVVSRIGRGEVGAHADPVNNAEMFVLLKDESEWREGFEQRNIEAAIRSSLSDFLGATATLTQPIAMSVDELLEGVRSELAIKLFGDDIDQLVESAGEIASLVREVGGAADVEVDQVRGAPQLQIEINRSAIARYGVNVSDVQEVIGAAIGGTTAGQIFEGVRRFDIWVRFAEEYRNSAKRIGETLIPAPNGILIPLSELASIKEVVGPRQIKRENGQRFITIQCNVVGRDIGSFVEDAKERIAESISLPSGYLLSWGGQFRLQQEANKRMAIVIPITLLLVLLMLYSNFNSLRNSFLILLNIPLALVGGVVALWLSGQNLSVPASVGFIALFGIALENGMVLVSYLNKLVQEGMELDEASLQGARLRVRPVLMTAVTTALGLLPLLFASGTGSEIQRPLATVVIGGLLTSTVLTLVVIPALYKWFAAAKTEVGSSSPSY